MEGGSHLKLEDLSSKNIHNKSQEFEIIILTIFKNSKNQIWKYSIIEK